jgi:citrate synthase
MADEKPKTNITSIAPGKILVKGYDISELMGRRTFAEVVYLILKGELPTEAEGKMMDAILTSSIDHGITPPSSLAARIIMSGGNPLNAAVAGGILTIGESHGGAIEQCARILQEWAARNGEAEELAVDLISDMSTKKMRMPGFGHRLHKVDPRTVRLFQIADELKFPGRHQKLARAVEAVYSEKGKELPINVDGAIAAIISDMDFDWRLGKAFFIISRTVGLVAHAHEERIRQKPMRNFGIAEHEYDGPQPRTYKAG